MEPTTPTPTPTQPQNIYRYKFTEDFSVNLYNFAKIHENDDRVTFKEAWEEWCEENDADIKQEIERTTSLGYKGNVLEKMFKSARYYYRKKGTEKKAPVRKNYVTLPEDILRIMDAFIQEHPNTKPSEGFKTFSEENPEIMRENGTWFCEKGYSTVEETTEKMKKTYKNRYFVAFRK
jgi:hypothetical protein